MDLMENKEASVEDDDGKRTQERWNSLQTTYSILTHKYKLMHQSMYYVGMSISLFLRSSAHKQVFIMWSQ